MRIPYAALRFSAEKKQTWDLTFSEKYEEIVLNTPGIL
jgi:hypothetical protein